MERETTPERERREEAELYRVQTASAMDEIREYREKLEAEVGGFPIHSFFQTQTFKRSN